MKIKALGIVLCVAFFAVSCVKSGTVIKPPKSSMASQQEELLFSAQPTYVKNSKPVDREITYSQGGVTVFALDDDTTARGKTGQPRYTRQNQYPIYDDMAPITSYQQSKQSNTSNSNAIYFNHGSSKLNKQDKKIIRSLASQLKASGRSANIVGYASNSVYTTKDPMQKNIINLHMGIKRAIAVTEELYKYGVSPTSLKTYSQGDAHSRGNDNKDRRVEFEIE